MAFGDRLKEARELNNLSRPELAQKLGVTKSAISNYENGVSSPKEDILLKMFNALQVDPNFLFQDSFIQKSNSQNSLLNQLSIKFGADAVELLQAYDMLNSNAKSVALTTVKALSTVPENCNLINESKIG